jgi:hypothetical protein
MRFGKTVRVPSFVAGYVKLMNLAGINAVLLERNIDHVALDNRTFFTPGTVAFLTNSAFENRYP